MRLKGKIFQPNNSAAIIAQAKGVFEPPAKTAANPKAENRENEADKIKLLQT